MKPTVCFTGIGPLGRKELTKKAVAMGYQVLPNVKYSLDVLVRDDLSNKTMSTKRRMAKSRGIRTITYEEFFGSLQKVSSTVKKLTIEPKTKEVEFF